MEYTVKSMRYFLLLALIAWTCTQFSVQAQNEFNFTVGEQQPINTFVGSLGPGFYFIISTGKTLFRISNTELRTERIFDRENGDQLYSILVQKSINGVSSILTVNVLIQDINDNVPIFPSSKVTLNIGELTAVGRKFSLQPARDKDFGRNGTVSYKISSGNMGNAFGVRFLSSGDSASLDLVVNKSLDRETVERYSLNLSACDNGRPKLCGFCIVTILIEDANDNAPLFDPTRYTGNITENSNTGTSILKVYATDPDSGTNSRIKYSIDTNTDNQRKFSIGESDGLITNNVKLDYEFATEYNIIVIAADSGSTPKTNIAHVKIRIIDENDNAPEIKIIFYQTGSYQVLENAPIGTNVARIYVSDKDSGINAKTDATLKNAHAFFALQRQSSSSNVYLVSINKAIDREATPQLALDVLAKDRGKPPKSTQKRFSLNIGDVNDNTPFFQNTPYSASVNESTSAGKSVYRALARDEDLGTNAKVVYSIINDNFYSSWFNIDSNTGVISATNDIDREKKQVVALHIKAEDSGLPSRDTNTTIMFTILDANDNAPMFSKPSYIFSVQENTTASQTVGTVSATDKDTSLFLPITYSIDGSSVFQINSKTGIITTSHVFDREKKANHIFTVYSKDIGGLRGNATVNVDILDINDNNPYFSPASYNISVHENTPVGIPVLYVKAKDNDVGDNAKVVYILKSCEPCSIFSINAATGGLYPSFKLDYAVKSIYRFTISAKDSKGLPAINSASVTIHILPAVNSPPKFEYSGYTFNFPETDVIGSFVGKVVAKRDNFGVGELFDYSFIAGIQSASFKVNRSGVIVSNKIIDYESKRNYSAVIQAKIIGTNLTANATLTISVLDLNDNTPTFNASSLELSLKEGVPLGYSVFSAFASDIDSGLNGVVSYSFRNNSSHFRINPKSGLISTKSLIDYETGKNFELIIIAADEGTPSRNSSLLLKINIKDINDNPPQFSKPSYFVNVAENAAIGYHFFTLNVSDVDSSVNGQFTLSLNPSQYSNMFSLTNNGQLGIAKELDREKKPDYSFIVTARDKGYPEHTAQAKLTIILTDINDNEPSFGASSFFFTVCEEQPPGTFVKTLSAVDKDEGSNGIVTYRFQPASNDFAINSVTGTINTKAKIDRESSRQIYNLIVNASDGGSPSKSSLTEVKISICDINDNAPEFSRSSPYSVSIVKTTSPGTNILQVHAVDKDVGSSSLVRYSLLGTLADEINSVKRFTINSVTGWIKTVSNFQSDSSILHTFSVVAKDKGMPQRVSIKKVLVFLLEGNKIPIVFQSYEAIKVIPETTALNTTIYTANVAVPNLGGGKSWVFSIVNGNSANCFKIHRTSGAVKVASTLSYESVKSFQLKIEVRDILGIDNRVGFMYVNIFLLDRNQRRPVFEKNPIILGKNENLPVGSLVYQASAIDADIDDNGRVVYSLISQGPGTAIFNINAFNGRITTTKALDREEVSEWTLILQAEDTAVDIPSRYSATATIKLLVFDINDNKPQFISKNYTYMMEDERVGYPVTRIVAKDADQGSNAAILYGITAGNTLGKFKMDSKTGEITLAKKLSYNEQSSYWLTLSASDGGRPSLTNQLVLKIEIIDVNNNSPKFTSRAFTGKVTEGSSVGTRVVQVKATDLDSGTNGKVIYSLEANAHFAIDKNTGWISTKAEIDREKWPSYQLSISADNHAWPFHSDTAIVRITVDDINDCPPVFVDGASINLTVFENLESTLVHRFVASDCDIGANAAVRYSITRGDTNTFNLVANTGVLHTTKELDRENIPFYEVQVLARNTAPPFQSITQTAKIWVGDLNDNRPIFSKNSYSTTIPENSPVKYSVLDVKAIDKDAGLNGQVGYTIVRNKSLVPFDIDPSSGTLHVSGKLDYEAHKEYTFEVKASDLAPYGKQKSVIKVQINISDLNDNPPKFSSPIFEGNTSSPIKILATDVDSGKNGEVRYRLVKSSKLISINSITGEVTFRSIILGRYKLQVEAYDLGSPRLFSLTTLIINEGSSLLIPKFLNRSASVKIPENSPVNFKVGKMVARSSSSAIKYDIESDSNNRGSGAAFKIDENTGVVSVNNPVLLDYEQVKWFQVVIRASINRNDSLSTYEKLRINLTDVNDNSPLIYPKNDDISLPEAVESEDQRNMFVKQFTATDVDSGVNGKILSYSILSGNEDGVFKIHGGILVLQKNLDFEKKRVHRLEIQAKDGGMPPRYKSTRLTLHVIDKNDNAPVFNKYGKQKVSEAARPGLLICIVKAVDPDRSSTITYSLKADKDIGQYFYIDQTQGLIKLLKKLDYEKTKLYKLVVFAKDGKHTSNMTLLVEVEDSNDNAPVFDEPGYVVYLPKIVQPRHVIIRLNATDKDSGLFGQVRYSIPYPPIDAFLIDQNSGVITATKKIILNDLNRPYELLVFAKDGGKPQLQTETRVHLRIKDPNYTGPKFDKSVYPKTKAVFESIPIGALIETVSVTDKSEIPGMQIEYSIQAGNKDGKFYIDPLYGKIQLVDILDRENVSRYTLVVRATDKGKPPQYADAAVKVVVVDSNDNSPVFEKKEYSVSVMENVTQGTELLTVNATDADDPNPKIGNGIIAQYSISSGNSLNWFEINSKGVLTLIRLLDRESKAVHRLTVKATDNGQPNVRSGFTSVVIKLIDVNDNRPEFTIPNIKDLEVLENSEEGKLVFKASAEDRDKGANGLVTYSIIGGNGKDFFKINNATGWVTTHGKTLDYEKQNLFKLRIRAVDHGKQPLSSSFEYRVAVKDVNEFSPQFSQKSYSFDVRGDAKVGTKIGQVNATDKDGGSWSNVRYGLAGSSEKLRINAVSGELFIKSDLRKQENRKRKRRSTGGETVSLVVIADNGPNTTGSTVPLKLSVDYTCPGCQKLTSPQTTNDDSLKGIPLVLVITFASIIAILLVCIVLFFMRYKRRKSDKEPSEANETAEPKAKYDDPAPITRGEYPPPDLLDGYHPSLFKQPSIGASSGRGSSESQLIGSQRPSFIANDNGSTHSFVVYHDNKPVLDSGIVGDFDRLSDVTLSDIAPSSDLPFGHTAEVASSVGSSFGRKHDVSSSLSRKLRKGVASSTQSESHDSLNDFMDEGGGEEAGRLDFGNLLYTKLAEVDADEQEAVMDGTRPFTDEGIPSRGGSLSTIIGSDEELRGNYNWDYLLDWGPQFQPLATVFSDIAKVQGSEMSEHPKMAMPRLPVLNRKGGHFKGASPHPEPIPLQNLPTKMPVARTESAESQIGSLKPNNRRDINHSNLISNRTSMLSSFSSLPHSPMSANSSYTSGPLSPNFTPAITPLITRSPSVSPLETPGLASPIGSKPTSVLDIAEKSRKVKGYKGPRQIEQTVPSEHNSEVEISV